MYSSSSSSSSSSSPSSSSSSSSSSCSSSSSVPHPPPSAPRDRCRCHRHMQQPRSGELNCVVFAAGLAAAASRCDTRTARGDGDGAGAGGSGASQAGAEWSLHGNGSSLNTLSENAVATFSSISCTWTCARNCAHQKRSPSILTAEVARPCDHPSVSRQLRQFPLCCSIQPRLCYLVVLGELLNCPQVHTPPLWLLHRSFVFQCRSGVRVSSFSAP